MDEQTIGATLKIYDEVYKNTREALELAGVPRNQLFFYLFRAPKLGDLIPEDVVTYY